VAPRPAFDLTPELAAHLVPARRLEERRGHRATGVAPLDALLGGGWPRAALSELSGRRSSGRTAILFASLARAIAAGETVALVDACDALDPRSAAACGIALPRLLWIRSAGDHALKAADLVVGAGGIDIVAVDLGERAPRAPSASWIRLKHGAERQGTTIVVATPGRVVGAFAAAAVELSAATPAFWGHGDPPLFDGLRVRAARGRGASDEEAACAWLAFTSHS
jgi:recA bacterial DNA recombination protein